MAPVSPRYDFGVAFLVSNADNLCHFARMVDVHHRHILRWAHDGFTHKGADRVACRLGWFPWVLWPEWWTMDSSEYLVDWVTVRADRMEARRVALAAERARQAELRRAMAAEAKEEARFRAAKEHGRKGLSVRVPIEARPCLSCGGAFTPAARNQLYCRMSCADSYRAAAKAAPHLTLVGDRLVS